MTGAVRFKGEDIRLSCVPVASSPGYYVAKTVQPIETRAVIRIRGPVDGRHQQLTRRQGADRHSGKQHGADGVQADVQQRRRCCDNDNAVVRRARLASRVMTSTRSRKTVNTPQSPQGSTPTETGSRQSH